RLQRTFLQLLRSPADITRIAYEAGYESHSAFNRKFRRLYGDRPALGVTTGSICSNSLYITYRNVPNYAPRRDECELATCGKLDASAALLPRPETCISSFKLECQ